MKESGPRTINFNPSPTFSKMNVTNFNSSIFCFFEAKFIFFFYLFMQTK